MSAKTKTVSLSRSAITWTLLSLWALLIAFGVVSLANPDWLDSWAERGAQAEAANYKHYGDLCLQEGDFRKAVAQYQRSLEIEPEQVGVMINLAIAWRHAGSPQQAVRVLREAAALETRLTDLIHFNQGELFEQEGKLDQALAQYEKLRNSIYVDPDLVHRKLGALYLRAKLYDEALAAFERTLTAQLDVTLPYQKMLWRCLDTYADDSANLAVIECQLTRGRRNDEFARYDLQIIRELQEIDPEIAKTHNHIGYIQLHRKDFTQAAHHYERSHEIWPGNRDARQGLRYLANMRQDSGARVSNK